jgi:hypothetical protein
MNVNELMKRKSVQIAFLVFSIVMCAYWIRGFADMARKSHMEGVIGDLAAAGKAMEKEPPGIQRAESFLAKIKTIRTGYAPEEFKQAFRDYISGFEQSLGALKAGQDTAEIDARIAEAKERMIACYRNYE